MRIRYEQLKLHPNVLHSLTGLRPAEFEHLVADVRPLLAVAEGERLARSPRRPLGKRKRAIGAGHPFAVPTQEQILLAIMWLRLYPTHEVLAFLFGVDPSTVSRLLRRILPVLAQAGKDTMRMPDPGRKHRRHFDQLLSELPDLAVLVDSFEQKVIAKIVLMHGWSDGPTLDNGGTRWDATKLGQQLATDIFKTRAPGLRLG